MAKRKMTTRNVSDLNAMTASSQRYQVVKTFNVYSVNGWAQASDEKEPGFRNNSLTQP